MHLLLLLSPVVRMQHSNKLDGLHEHLCFLSLDLCNECFSHNTKSKKNKLDATHENDYHSSYLPILLVFESKA